MPDTIRQNIHYTLKAITQLGLLSTSALLLGCIDPDTDNNKVDFGMNGGGIPIPMAIQKSASLDSSTLKAYIKVDGGSAQKMNITGEEAQLTISGLTPGKHSFTIEFRYENGANNILLVSASKTLSLGTGSNELAYSEQEYSYPDDDNDGNSNLVEIAASTYGLPTIVSTTPSNDGEKNVPLDIAITARFDKEISPATANKSTFTLLDATGNTVAGTINIDISGKVITFTPDNKLVTLGCYSASLRNGITDMDGNAIRPFAWRFATGDGCWTGAEQISNSNSKVTKADPSPPQIAMDNNGNALVVWSHDTGISAIRYTSGTGWDKNGIQTLASEGISSPQVAIDDNGDILAVWQQDDAGQPSIWASYFSNNNWGIPKVIENSVKPAFAPQVVMDSQGNALVVWKQSNDNQMLNNYSIFSYHHIAGDQLEKDKAKPIKITASEANAYRPRITMGADGNAFVIWTETEEDSLSGTLRYTIQASRCSVSSDLICQTKQIDPENKISAAEPQIIADTNGNALAVWKQHEGAYHKIWANHYTAGSGWDNDATRIGPDDKGPGDSVRVAMDASGNALAVWVQSTDGKKEIWATRYAATEKKWSEAGSIGISYQGDDSSSPQIQINMDANGNALVVWQQYDDKGRPSIHASRYISNSGWIKEAAAIETTDAWNAYSPQIAIDADGNAHAVWYQYDDENYRVFANRFEQGEIDQMSLYSQWGFFDR